MTSRAVWPSVMKAIDRLSVTTPTGSSIWVETLLDLWCNGTTPLGVAAECLASTWLGASEIDGPEGTRYLLAVPARINELAVELGDTYWQTLAKAPAKIVVSKTGQMRIREVRHLVVMVDVVAWRAWSAENRDPEDLTDEELRGFVDRVMDLNERKREIGEDIKEVYAEAKARGYDTTILRKVVSILESDTGREGWNEAVTMIDLYLDHARSGGG